MNRLRYILLASMLLVTAPTFAQTSDAPDSRPAPSGAANESPGVAWSSLSADQRKMLSRYEGKWDSLPAERQQALNRGSQRWLKMSPDQKRDAKNRFERWNDLPPEHRRVVRDRWQQFRSLPPDEQRLMRENFRKFKNLPPDRRKMLRERWQKATPAERQNMLERTREKRERQEFKHRPRRDR